MAPFTPLRDHGLGDKARGLIGAEQIDAEDPLPIRPGGFERIGVDDDGARN